MLILRRLSPVCPGRFYYYQQETQHAFPQTNNFGHLLSEIRKHRIANAIPIGTNFANEIQNFICRHLPDEEIDEWCIEEGARNTPPKPITRREPSGWDGSKVWAELHRYALFQRPTSEQRKFWLADWGKRVKCGECRQHWRALYAHNPLPDSSTPDQFFEKTVQWHNATNAMLGKPEISLEEARRIWST